MDFLTKPEYSPSVIVGQLTRNNINLMRRVIIPVAGTSVGIFAGLATGPIGGVIVAEAITIALEQVHEKFIVRASAKIY